MTLCTSVAQALYLLVVTVHRIALAVADVYHAYQRVDHDYSKPTSRYYLTNAEAVPFDDDDRFVPEGCVYVEEWLDSRGHKKCVVLYEDEPVPRTWTSTPFDGPPPWCPWVWVGDVETEIDMTRTFDKFLVVGNVITIELVEKLIHVTSRTHLKYITTGTFTHVEFPGEGITIKADDALKSL